MWRQSLASQDNVCGQSSTTFILRVECVHCIHVPWACHSIAVFAMCLAYSVYKYVSIRIRICIRIHIHTYIYVSIRIREIIISVSNLWWIFYLHINVSEILQFTFELLFSSSIDRYASLTLLSSSFIHSFIHSSHSVSQSVSQSARASFAWWNADICDKKLFVGARQSRESSLRYHWWSF